MVKKTPGTEVIDWEKQMAEDARIAAEAQRSAGGGGKFFSVRGGVLTWDGNEMPGNRAIVVVLADVMENSYYDKPFDPDDPASPVCFAYGKQEDEMEPHEAVDNDPYFTRQHATCAGCPQNEWGSAPVGKGKACKNVMRLAVIPAGVMQKKGTGRNITFEPEIYTDEEHFERAEVGFIKLPVMSVKNWSAYVKQISTDMRRPPHGIITEMYVEPDPKSQYAIKFDLVEPADSSIIPVLMKRHGIEQARIDFPYVPPQEREEDSKPARANNKLKGKGRR